MNVWLKGLLAAVIGGAVGAGASLMTDPVTFDFSTGWKKLLGAILGGALIALFGYLKQSPLPGKDCK